MNHPTRQKTLNLNKIKISNSFYLKKQIEVLGFGGTETYSFLIMKSQTQKPQSPSPFPFAVTRIAVAQICQSVGFKSAQNSALQSITDIAIRYVQSLAASATASANSTGRTQSNLLDIIFAIEHLHSIKGFPGGSNVNQRFYISGPLLDIIKFVKYSNETPFAKPLTRRRFKEREGFLGLGSGMERGKDGRNYIPRWLPGIPEMGGKEGGERKEFGFGGEECLIREKIGVGGIIMKEENVGKVIMRELPVKRVKVRFKMGFVVGEGKRGGMGFPNGGDLGSGVCNGGKNVFVQICSGNDKNEKKLRKKASSCKKKSYYDLNFANGKVF